MPTNLTGDPATFPVQTAPATGEPRTAASVATPFQRAADRSEYLKDRLLYLDPDKSGVQRFRRVASTTALKALAGMSDKTVCQVDGGFLYQYDAASSTAEALPAVAAPNVGGGRWFIIGYGGFNVANGIPQLDANAKVPGARLAICNSNGRVTGANIVNGRHELMTVASAATSSCANDDVFRDFPGMSMTVTLVTGDLVLVSWDVGLTVSPDDKAATTVKLTKPGGATVFSNTGFVKSFGENLQVQLQRHYVATADGAHTFVVQGMAPASNGSSITLGSVVTNFGRLEVVKP